MNGFQGDETVRVDFPDGEWVDVKEELSQADQDYILNAMAQLQDGKMSMTLGRLALLERSVKAWSFPEPVTKENINTLKVKYRTVLLEKIDALNSAATEFRKN
jgi:hypothetical protein